MQISGYRIYSQDSVIMYIDHRIYEVEKAYNTIGTYPSLLLFDRAELTSDSLQEDISFSLKHSPKRFLRALDCCLESFHIKALIMCMLDNWKYNLLITKNYPSFDYNIPHDLEVLDCFKPTVADDYFSLFYEIEQKIGKNKIEEFSESNHDEIIEIRDAMFINEDFEWFCLNNDFVESRKFLEEYCQNSDKDKLKMLESLIEKEINNIDLDSILENYHAVDRKKPSINADLPESWQKVLNSEGATLNAMDYMHDNKMGENMGRLAGINILLESDDEMFNFNKLLEEETFHLIDDVFGISSSNEAIGDLLEDFHLIMNDYDKREALYDMNRWNFIARVQQNAGYSYYSYPTEMLYEIYSASRALTKSSSSKDDVRNKLSWLFPNGLKHYDKLNKKLEDFK